VIRLLGIKQLSHVCQCGTSSFRRQVLGVKRLGWGVGQKSMATVRTALRRAQRRPLSAWVVAALAAALVLMRSCGGAVAAGPLLGTLKTTQLVMPLGPLPKRPLLMQLNARVMLHELSGLLGRPATLDDIQDAQLDELAKTGYHMVYLLGVWKVRYIRMHIAGMHVSAVCMWILQAYVCFHMYTLSTRKLDWEGAL